MRKEVHIYYLLKNLIPKLILHYCQFYFIFYYAIFVNNVQHNQSFKSTSKLITIFLEYIVIILFYVWFYIYVCITQHLVVRLYD